MTIRHVTAPEQECRGQLKVILNDWAHCDFFCIFEGGGQDGRTHLNNALNGQIKHKLVGGIVGRRRVC
mgnify:CR=1 FL=1